MAGIALLMDLLRKNPASTAKPYIPPAYTPPLLLPPPPLLTSPPPPPLLLGLYSGKNPDCPPELKSRVCHWTPAPKTSFYEYNTSRFYYEINDGSFGGKRFAYCDAGATPPLLTEDYLSSLRTASETIFRHDTLNYRTKEYYIELKPLFSAFHPKSFVLTSLRSFLLFYLPILVPKVEDDDNDFLPDSSDEHHVDLIIPFKRSVKQILRETSVVTTRRVLERLAVHHFSQRAAWKLLKDISKSAMRKANRGMPIHTYFFCVSRTTFRGHFLGVAASWLVQVGIECYRFARDVFKSNQEEAVDVDFDQSERVKVLGKKVYGVTVRCGASLVFASIGAGIGATLFRPSSGQSVGCLLGDMTGPIIVSFCFSNVGHLEL